MQRYFLNKEDFMSNIIHGDDVFHIYKVMRNKPGDLIEVCYDGVGKIAKILEITSDFVAYELIDELKQNNEFKPKITLLQGLAKGEKNEDIIKHGTELGIDEILFLQMKRSVVKITNDKLDNKLTRYAKIAKEASEQSHRFSIPSVNIVKNIKDIDFSQYDLRLLLDEEEAKKEVGNLLKNVSFIDKKSIIFVVGPEGGIDLGERDFFINSGFIPVSLGKNILRTETASLAFLSMLMYEYMKG